MGALEHFFKALKTGAYKFWKETIFYMNMHACGLSTCQIFFNNMLYCKLHKKDKITATKSTINKPI